MSTSDDFYRWGKTEPLSADNFTRRFLDLNKRLIPLESLDLSYQALVGEVNDKVLAQVAQTITSLEAQLVDLLQMQWLTGVSGTSVLLTAGTDAAVSIAGPDVGLFAPGPFAIMQRNGDPTVYAVIQSQNYDRTNGTFNFHILTAQGGPGPFSDWSFGALAGSTLAQMTLLQQGIATLASVAADAAAAHADRVQTDLDAAATAADRAATHTDRLAADADAAATAADRVQTGADRTAMNQAIAAAANGPVVSVNGKGGVVTLAVGDIAGAAPTASPVLTGTPRAPTPAAGDVSTAVATMAALARDIAAAVAFLTNGAPGTLDTLKEIADAIGDDPAFASTISAALAARVRTDAPQAIPPARQAWARQNIRAISRGQAQALASF